MAYKNSILLGRIIKVTGYEGAVIVKLEKFFSENIPQMESVSWKLKGGRFLFLYPAQNTPEQIS